MSLFSGIRCLRYHQKLFVRFLCELNKTRCFSNSSRCTEHCYLPQLYLSRVYKLMRRRRGVYDPCPCLGTYFNCIMFMVASSVVTTIMILNYHHRLADTHEMPEWVREDKKKYIWGVEPLDPPTTK